MIEKIESVAVIAPNSMALMHKINEMIDEINRLAKEPVAHEHREISRGGPHPDLNRED